MVNPSGGLRFSRQQRTTIAIAFLLATLYLTLVPYQSDTINLCDERDDALQTLSKAVDDFTQYQHLDRVANSGLKNESLVLQSARDVLQNLEKYGRRLRIVNKMLDRRGTSCGKNHIGEILTKAETRPLFGLNPVSGVLNVLMAVIGMKEGRVVELENAESQGCTFGIGGFVTLGGWDGFAVCGRWSGYNRYHETFESSLVVDFSKIGLDRGGHSVITEKRGKGKSFDMREELRVLGFGGHMDVLMLWVDMDEYDVWDRLDGILPRVVALRFQDYWGWESTVKRKLTSNDSDRGMLSYGEAEKGRRSLFVGASLSAFVKLSIKKGYRLVHCLEATPIALFLHHKDDNNYVSPIHAQSCFAKRLQNKDWVLDKQAQWDRAQYYAWDNMKPLTD